MGGLIQDLRFGARVLMKAPGTTAVAVLALALGIGANTATFSGVRALVLNPLPFRDLDRIVRVWDSDPKHGAAQNMVSAGDFHDWRERSRSFARLAAFNVWNGNLTGSRRSRAASGRGRVPRPVPAAGDGSPPGPDLRSSCGAARRDDVVVLSHGLWQRRFGSDRNIVGRTIELNERSLHGNGRHAARFRLPHRYRALGAAHPDRAEPCRS